MSNQLQNKKATLGNVANIIKGVVALFKNLCSDVSYVEFWQKVQNVDNKNNVPSTMAVKLHQKLIDTCDYKLNINLLLCRPLFYRGCESTLDFVYRMYDIAPPKIILNLRLRCYSSSNNYYPL